MPNPVAHPTLRLSHCRLPTPPHVIRSLPATPARMSVATPSKSSQRSPYPTDEDSLLQDWAPTSALEVSSQHVLDAALHIYTDRLVVLEVYSNSCRPCIGIKRGFQKSVEAHAHHARFMKLNADNHRSVSQELGVRSLPTFILYKNGSRIDHFSSSSRDTLEEYITDNL